MRYPNGHPPIVGRSPAIQRAIALAEQFAPTNVPVLLVGATGTGKELLAQAIHRWSRRDGEMVDVNCAALPRDLVEAELFGHGPRAFTSAREGRAGLIEAADGSTLFLDEVGSLAWEAQGKLLRVLETGELRRVGEIRKRRVNVRVVAAAQDDLPERVKSGAFRLDLYHRLAGLLIELPPLAQRPEDVIPLAQHFAAQQGRVLEAPAAEALTSYSWPGNVRELCRVIERAGYLVDNGTLLAEAVRNAMAMGVPHVHTIVPPVTAEVQRLLTTCEQHGWDTRRAADSLGMPRSTLYDRLRAGGVSLRALRKARRPEFRRNSA